jgi:glyceraldehyde 3-phosphate dehydrogenase
LKYDSVHGRFNGTVEVKRGNFCERKKHCITAERNPADLKWNEVDVDVVAECTGFYNKKQPNIKGGAKSYHFSTFSRCTNVCNGVNHTEAKASDLIVSNASCTTNCLAPLAKVINDNFGIVEALMTTVHTTSTQMTTGWSF